MVKHQSARASRLPTAIAVVLVPILGILLEGLLVRLPHNSAGMPANGERLGAVHIHTVASDGSGTLTEVTAAARQADLSFMAITDHNVAMDRAAVADDPPDFPVIAGEELTTSSGHFYTLGIPPGWRRPPAESADALLASAHAAGGYNIVAHPFHARIPWTDWKTSDFDGFEVWNEDAVWRRNNPLDILISLLLYPVNNQLALVRLARTPDRELAKWDELLAQRPIPAFCGADAHAALRLGHGWVLRFPGYLSVFEVAREHVLLGPGAGNGDPGRASAAEILGALTRGHAFCALDALYPANGFTAQISSGGVSGQPGDFLAWANAGTVHVAVPSGSSQPLIKVIRDGRTIIEKQARSIDEPLPGPGSYRTEVYLRQPGLTGWRRWTLWIFSNPIYVTATADHLSPIQTPAP